MKDGLGIFLWKISVALYLIANGVLGLQKWSNGDFYIIFNRMGFSGDTRSIFVGIVSVVALVAGIAIILEMLNVSIPILDTLILIIAIIWAVYVVVEIFGWVTGKARDDSFFFILQRLGVHLMVLANLLIASKKG